jgi:hypothetical protein
MVACCASNCGPGNLRISFLRHFLAEPHFTYDSNKKKHAVRQYIEPYLHPKISTKHNVRHSCTVVWIILAAIAVSAWRWVMQFLPGGGKWQLEVCKGRNFRISPGPAQGPHGPPQPEPELYLQICYPYSDIPLFQPEWSPIYLKSVLTIV